MTAVSYCRPCCSGLLFSLFQISQIPIGLISSTLGGLSLMWLLGMASMPRVKGLQLSGEGRYCFSAPPPIPRNTKAIGGAERRIGTPGPFPTHLGRRQGKKFGKALPHP